MYTVAQRLLSASRPTGFIVALELCGALLTILPLAFALLTGMKDHKHGRKGRDVVASSDLACSYGVKL